MASVPARSAPRAAHLLLLLLLALFPPAGGVEVLSKSRLERCVRDSGAGDTLACDRKIVLDLAVPSGAVEDDLAVAGKGVAGPRVPDAALEAGLGEDLHAAGGREQGGDGEEEQEEEVRGAGSGSSDKQTRHTVRDPPVITINKSATYAIYDLYYIRDVAYKPDEKYVTTRKCRSDAGANIVHECERLRDQNGRMIEQTEPVCCSCGPHRRVDTSCGTVIDRQIKGESNTAHCVRFPGDWFHVFGIGRRSIGFSIRVQVKKGSSVTEVIVGPENRTAISKDNFLRVNLIGDFVGYTSVPTFEDFYLGVGDGQPQVLGDDFSKWMLLERDHFTLDGLECNRIGVGYEAYRNQPSFCSAPFGSCLSNQLWNYWEADKNRINRNEESLYIVQGKFDRINQHPHAGVNTFSIGVTETMNTNLLIELSADDIDYIYQRSPGKIISIKVPTFEALSQVGTAQVTVKNIGKLEASYSLTFDCLSGIASVEEQLFIMKPDEVLVRSFYLRSSTDEASEHRCKTILKAADFRELDRAECQFTTTATVNNGTRVQKYIGPPNQLPKGFIEFIKALWRGTVRSISSPADHAVAVVLWLLHQNGLFDPLEDWWEDMFGQPETAPRSKRQV